MSFVLQKVGRISTFDGALLQFMVALTNHFKSCNIRGKKQNVLAPELLAFSIQINGTISLKILYFGNFISQMTVILLNFAAKIGGNLSTKFIEIFSEILAVFFFTVDDSDFYRFYGVQNISSYICSFLQFFFQPLLSFTKYMSILSVMSVIPVLTTFIEFVNTFIINEMQIPR